MSQIVSRSVEKSLPKSSSHKDQTLQFILIKKIN